MSYQDIIKWYRENNQPYNIEDFRTDEDVIRQLSRIIDFANGKATLSERFVWERKDIKAGIKDIIANAKQMNNDRYFDKVKSEIDVNMDYDRVDSVKIDSSYEVSQRLQEVKLEKLQRLGRETLKEVKRTGLDKIGEIKVPERLRQAAQVEVEKKLRKSVQSATVTAKTLKKHEANIREAGIELSPEVRQELRQREVSLVGEAVTLTRDIRLGTRSATSAGELDVFERQVEKNRELILSQKHGDIALSSLLDGISVKREMLSTV